MWNFPLLPEQASAYAAKVDPLFYALAVFVLTFTMGVTTVFIVLGVRYRKRRGVHRKSVHVENMLIELVWSAIPVVIAIAIFAWGAVLYYDHGKAPGDTIDINVIGKQWMWKIQHPNGLREVNELHVPKGRPVKLIMTSQDVIHSFYVPAFRKKQDVLPARYTSLWFEATKVGEYPLFCAEYCGTEHSLMGGTVYVMEPSDYEEWLGGGPALTPAAEGEAIFQKMGCATCHDAGDSSRGPSLNGLYGKDVKLRGGGTIPANDEYLRRSIMEPTADVVVGYTPLMPAFKTQFNEDDILSLLAYIKSLGGGTQE